MALKTAKLRIDRAALPLQRSDLGIRFQRQSVATIKAADPGRDMVLIRAAGSLLSEEEAVGPEPRFNLVLCGMQLKARDGTDAQGSGQLVITGHRLIGMISSGTATGSPPLALETSGNVFCFACRRDDVYSPQIKKHRLKPSDFSFRSKEELAVGFQLTVFSAVAHVANGKMNYWYDKNMLHAMSEEGQKGLCQE